MASKDVNFESTELIELARHDLEKMIKCLEYGNLTVAEPLAKGVINRVVLFFGKNGVRL